MSFSGNAIHCEPECLCRSRFEAAVFTSNALLVVEGVVGRAGFEPAATALSMQYHNRSRLPTHSRDPRLQSIKNVATLSLAAFKSRLI